MYDEKSNKRGIQWGNMLRGIVKFLVIIIAIFLIIFVITKCTRGIKNIKNSTTPNTKITLSSQLESLQNATIKYANEGNLPTAAYASKTIRLKELQEQGMISTLKDSKGNACNATGTYARITKLENNYMTRLNVVCNKKSESKTIYIGCFSDCGNGNVCLGSKNKLEGLCNAPAKTESTAEQSTKTTTNNTNANTSTNTNNSSSGNSVDYNASGNPPSLFGGGTSTSTSANSNTSTSNENRVESHTPVTRTMYEFKKYNTTYTCAEGIVEGNRCMTLTRPIYDYDKTLGHIYTCPSNQEFKIYNHKKYCATYKEATQNKTVVDTTWSYSTYLDGYERTGNTKQVTE